MISSRIAVPLSFLRVPKISLSTKCGRKAFSALLLMGSTPDKGEPVVKSIANLADEFPDIHFQVFSVDPMQ
jgi:hypothetical protein